MRITALAYFLVGLALCSPSYAHQDTALTLTGTKLQGLPEQYSPATFSYATRELTVGTNSVVIPEVIWKLFGDTERVPIVFSASWYHGPLSELPHYLYMRNRHCGFLINLNTLEMMDFMRDRKITQEALKNWTVTRRKTPQSGPRD